jgi:hypothetical protein
VPSQAKKEPEMFTLEQLKAHRKLWVEALRSGEYEQGKEALLDQGKLCCLGVLCKVAGLEPYRTPYGQEYGFQVPPGHTNVYAPQQAMEFVGLKQENGQFDEGMSLVDHNDGGSTFKEIADIIERDPAGLFTDGAGS